MLGFASINDLPEVVRSVVISFCNLGFLPLLIWALHPCIQTSEYIDSSCAVRLLFKKIYVRLLQ
jgi:hypothetical protein